MSVIIKGRYITPEKPLICVPVMGKTADEIIENARSLCEKNVEIIEWRADFFEGISDSKKVRDLLDELRNITIDTILIVTLRSRNQGGKCTMSEEEARALLLEIAQVHSADIIDVEYFTFEHPERIIERLHERGALVIASHHDFHETPPGTVMQTLLDQMAEADADIVKLAVMPQTMQDVSNLLSVTDMFVNENPGIPAVTMSMGTQGVISRVGGFMFGSCITFAADEENVSAPGQLPYGDVKNVIELLNTSK